MSSNILNFDIYGKQIFLIGTAHVSSESVDEVRLAIRDNKPDCVCVETDEGRFKTMTEKNNWEKLDIVSKLMASLLSSVLSKEVLSTEEIKNLKDKSVLDGMMCGLASFLPSMKEVLNDQRDRFLTTKIFQSRHRLGVLAGWVIPAALLAMIVIGFLKSGATASFGLLAKWLIIHGIGSAIGTLLALGSPITIFASFVGSPVVVLKPFRSIRGFYRNKITKILLVFFFASLGGAIGNFVSLPIIGSLVL